MKSIRFPLLVALAMFAMEAQSALLFDRGDAAWRWRPGTNEASTPITAWRTNGFVDTQFGTAPAPFWSGDALPGGTQITGMQNVYLCIFLRKSFVITNIAEIRLLRLGALVNDGFTAWINGTEVQRVNMIEPSGADVTVSNLAANAAQPAPFLLYNLTNSGAYLIPGENTLAVQVFKSSLGSSDLAFDASLETIVVDTNPPTVLAANPPPGSTVGGLSAITVTFSEPVSGVDAADLLINGFAATGVDRVSSAIYSFGFSQPAFGPVQITWRAGRGRTPGSKATAFTGIPGPGIADLALPPNPFNATGPGATWQYTLVDKTRGPIISEFMAANINGTGALLDEDGDSSDWIEIQNAGGFPVNLFGWSLTDEAGSPGKWVFPATNLASGGFLVVFASGKDRPVPGARLHTNFKLSGNGDYLALVRPDGSIASEFAPMYPQQAAGVSYGLGVLSTNSTLVATSSPVRVRIPLDAADGTNWLHAGFDDSGWTAGTNGVGFGGTNVAAAGYGAAVLPTSPMAYWRLNEASGTVAANLGSGVGLNGTYSGAVLGTAGPRPPQFNGFESNNTAPTFTPASGSYVEVPSPLLNNRSIFTMAGWIKPASAQADRTGLFGQNDCVEFGFISASGLQLWTFVGQIDFAYPFPFGQWHHIAAVGTGTQLQLYLDGTLRASSALGTIGTSTFKFNIGGGGIFDATGNHFNGQIDEVAVWDRALNAAELLGLYNAGTTPAGVSVAPFVKTDVGSAMSNVNATAYIRLPFTIEDPSNIRLLTLRMRHDDGFVAYVNGIEVARANAPDTPAFNSAATTFHTAATVDSFLFGAAMLRAGENVLAIQGLNAAAADADFLISAELTATHDAAASANAVYMTVPSPGAANGGGVSVLGPAIRDTTHSPIVPLDAQDLLVTARVKPTFASIGSVAVRYRIMYGAEVELPMFDDGTHGDVLPGDGVYSQTLPVATSSTNGQMIRWYFKATDSLGRASRWPLFLSPVDEEYLGTVVDPGYVTSKLPIFHLFISPQNLPAVDAETGGRISLFYDGEFYDNIYMEVRGNTSAGQVKKSHRLEFNRDHAFRHLPVYPRVRKTSLMAEFLDPAYLRQHLCFWLLDRMGVPSPFFYPVRGQLNGSFYALAYHSDVIDLEQIQRMGYDPAGALYKAVGNCLPSESSTGVFQKKSDPLADHSDYQTLVRAINETNTLAGRRKAAFDMLDIPEVVNYLAGARWCAENDDVWANMSLYRDTTNGSGDGLWRIIPFDMNASWGQRYGGITPLDAINDNCKSHPLYGGSTIIACDGGTYNRIYDTIITLPETRQMLLRRQRTVLDRWMLEPGVAPESRLLESHIRYMTNLFWTEAFLDRAKWGYSTWTASNKPLTNAVTELFNEFINLRRIHFSATHNITNAAKPIGLTPASNAGIPLSQPLSSLVIISNIDFNPASRNQDHEYIQVANTNNHAMDISGWKLDGAARFTFKQGTILPSNGFLYVSPNVVAFRQRTTSPRGGEGNFVVGPYQGRLNARGETLYIYDDRGGLVLSNTFIGAPSPAQLFLRITEVMYNPAALAGNTNDPQQFEYIELKNISADTTLDLDGVKLANGVDFAFAGSAITTLAPGARALVVRNLAAFTARYGDATPVAGQYAGILDNAGERLQLLDSFNEEILDFSYNNSWYPATDGHGFSLVVVDETAQPDRWGSKSNWRPSGALSGSPGVADPPPPVLAPIVINELLSHSVLPAVDTVELLNPTASAVNIGGWFLSDDFDNVFKYRFTNGTIIPAGGYLVIDENQFNNPATARVPFAFSSAGDEVRLSSGDANTNLTGYMTGESFGAAQARVSFGRHTNSQGAVHFVAQAFNSFNSSNSLPRVSPIVLSEIMYHPPDVITESGPTDDVGDEYIELKNITGSAQPLYDPDFPTNTWRLRDAVAFTFPTNVVLPPGGQLVVVSFDPSDAAAAGAFRFRNSASALSPLFGPWQGKLDNSSDSVELVQPNPPATNGVSYFLADKVYYGQGSGWTTNADGTGLALQRVAPSEYGDDPINWIAAGRTPGFDASNTNGPVVTAQPKNATVVSTLSAMFSVTATGAPPIVYQWRLNGTPILGAVSPLLMLTNLQGSQAGQYSCFLENASGTTVTSDATLTVIALEAIPPGYESGIPGSPSVTAQPQDQTVLGGAGLSRMFSVMASGDAPLSYRWLYGSSMISNATSSLLILTNIQVSQRGNYRCIVVNNFGYASSGNALLNVLQPPQILQQPASIDIKVRPDPGADVLPNTNATIIMVATTTSPPLTFQWRMNGTNLLPSPHYSNVNAASLIISNVTMEDFGEYSCALEDRVGRIFSSTVTLFPLVRPTIQIPFPNQTQTVVAGSSFPVSAVLSNGWPPPFGYQWRSSGSTIITNLVSDSKTNFFVYPASAVSASAVTGALYRLVVTNRASPAIIINAPFYITTLLDTDHDGIPDSVESALGLNPNSAADALLDLDGDRMSNLAEYQAGTDPANSASYLKIENSILPGAATLRFAAVSNRTYTIQFSGSLGAASWSPLADFVAFPTNRVEVMIDRDWTTNRFYRVVTPRQP